MIMSSFMLRIPMEEIDGLNKVKAPTGIFESYTYKKYRIDISIDEDMQWPRDKDYKSNLGTIVVVKNRHFPGDDGEMLSYEQIVEHMSNKDIVVSHEIHVYDHGSIALSDNPYGWPGEIWPDQRWDVYQLGYIYATKDDIRREYGVKRISKKLIEKVSKILLSELREIDLYCRFERYGYIVTLIDTGEFVDGCTGFITHDTYDIIEFAINNL